jgi:hypothetical protein
MQPIENRPGLADEPTPRASRKGKMKPQPKESATEAEAVSGADADTLDSRDSGATFEAYDAEQDEVEAEEAAARALEDDIPDEENLRAAAMLDAVAGISDDGLVDDEPARGPVATLPEGAQHVRRASEDELDDEDELSGITH